MCDIIIEDEENENSIDENIKKESIEFKGTTSNNFNNNSNKSINQEETSENINNQSLFNINIEKEFEKRNSIQNLLATTAINRIDGIQNSNPWHMLGITHDDLSNICTNYTINFGTLKLALNSLANALAGHELYIQQKQEEDD